MLATDLVRTKQIPGFSVAVGRGRNIIWSEGFGLADVEQKVAVTPLTRFRLGSVSKIITAAGFAKLIEAGTLDPDAPVQRYVPSFPKKQWAVSVKQLAGHIGGVRHYRPDDFTITLKAAPHFNSVASSLGIFVNDPLLFEPGTEYSYSSYGWNLLSAVIEGASGQEFLRFMQANVFDPLGLRSIGADHPFQIIPDRAAFYMRDKDNTLLNVSYSDNSYKWASGGFLGSAEDLVRFGLAHLRPEFFRQTTLDLLFTSQKLASGKETGVGIGWRVGLQEGRRILHHGGSLDGGRAMVMLFPESGVAVAMLANIYADFGEKDAVAVAECFTSK